MAIRANVSNDEKTHPPLFVTGFTEDGVRHEALLDAASEGPGWMLGKVSVRVSAPGGASAQAELRDARPENAYMQCCDLIGEDRMWMPVPTGYERANALECELWSRGEATVENDDRWLRVHLSDPREDRVDPESSERPRFVAVIRNPEGTVLHTVADSWFFLDVAPFGVSNGDVVVPRAIVDTGLAGALWGFIEQHNHSASSMVAERLLSVLFERKSGQQSTQLITLIAAAHAVLTHRELIENFGSRLVKELSGLKSNIADLPLLIALIELAMPTTDVVIRKQKLAYARTALAILAQRPPIFGETLRWLDAKFAVLAALMHDAAHGDDPQLDADLTAVSDRLETSIVGGQLAVYVGEPPLQEILGASAQKKTLETSLQ